MQPILVLYKIKKHIVWCFSLLLIYTTTFSQSNIYVELPSIIKGNITEHKLFYDVDVDTSFTTTISIYHFTTEIDSVLLNTYTTKLPFLIDKKYASIDTFWKNNATNSKDFKTICNFTNKPIPGFYSIYTTINKQTTKNIWLVDSSISTDSKIFQNIISAFKQNKKLNYFVNKISAKQFSTFLKPEIQTDLKANIFTAIQKGIKALSKEINIIDNSSANNCIYSFYYQNIFIGYFNMDAKAIAQKIVTEKTDELKNNITNSVNAQFTDVKTLLTEIKDEQIKKKKNNKIDGKIDWQTHVANDQNEYSMQDKIYSEFNANCNANFYGIPFQIDAYYTTQDKNRMVKASYFKVHYNFDEAKKSMQDASAKFTQMYEDKKSEMNGIQNIYQSYLNNLEAQKSNLKKEVLTEFNINKTSQFDSLKQAINKYNPEKIDTTALLKTTTNNLKDKIEKDSTISSSKQKYDSIKAKMTEKYAQAKKKLEKIEKIEKTALKYYEMINQFRTSQHYDSALVLSTIQKYTKVNAKDMSLNNVLSENKNLLPSSKMDKLTKGIKNFNIGIFNKQESEYTIAGQNIKGGNVEYVKGKYEFGATVGKSQYISPYGSIDQYNSYLGKIAYIGAKEQKYSIIYYAYALADKQPDKDYYAQATQYLNKLNNAQNVLAATYENTFFEKINFKGELAKSFASTDILSNTNFTNQDFFAHKYAVDGNIAKLNIKIFSELEHVGKSFQNKSLPFLRTNYTAFKIGLDGSVLNGYLNYKIDYNEYIQHAVTNAITNRKIGYEAHTISRRYPNMAVSYKPFTTFRNYTDTFVIPQRPLFGYIYTFKLSYQFKKNKISHRFTIANNNNKTINDSIQSQSNNLQATYIYSSPSKQISVSTGFVKNKSSLDTSANPFANNQFVNANQSFKINKRISITASQEIAINKTGLQKIGALLGTSFQLPRKPFAFKVDARYLYYQNPELVFKTIVSSNIGISYFFSEKFK